MSQPKLRIYPVHFQAIESACIQILHEGRAADKVLEVILRSNPQAGSRDRSIIAESTYDIVRWLRLYCWQFGLIDEIPPQEFATIIAGYFTVKYQTYLPWMPALPNEIRIPDHNMSGEVKHSLPDWMFHKIQEDLGDAAELTCTMLNQPAPVYIRINDRKISTQECHDQLEAEGITNVIKSEQCIQVLKKGHVFRNTLFTSGCYEVQDIHSQCVAPFCQVEPQMRIIDACAGGGGKSLHLHNLLMNTGRIISLDTDARKLQNLKQRARRAGATNIETRHIDSTKVIKRLAGSAQRVLLDVPCTGSGVLRRNPDTKWKLSLTKLHELTQIQKSILHSYASMVETGGKLIYATCSIFHEENHQQVQKFLLQHPEFTLEEEQTLLPQSMDGDGFYMARMLRH